MPVTGRSVLVVPLPGLADTLPLLAEADGPVPHIGLLDPFPLAPETGTLAELTSFFADVVPFPVTLTGVSQFPGGSAYLTPQPPAPFRHLVHGLSRLFPELPRHRTAFGESVPHLSLPEREGEDLTALQEQLEADLPVTTVAREAALWWREDAETRTLATFAFGTSAA